MSQAGRGGGAPDAPAPDAPAPDAPAPDAPAPDAPAPDAPAAHGGNAVSTDEVMRLLAEFGRDQRLLRPVLEKLQGFERSASQLHTMLRMEQKQSQYLTMILNLEHKRVQDLCVLLSQEQQRVQDLARENIRMKQALGNRTRGPESACVDGASKPEVHAHATEHDGMAARGGEGGEGGEGGKGGEGGEGGKGGPKCVLPPMTTFPPSTPSCLQDPVLERTRNVHPLLDIYRWSFPNAEIQTEFWTTLWKAPEFNKSCRIRKPDPVGAAWSVLRGLGYTNVGRQESYHKPDHLEFKWSITACLQNTYKNSKTRKGVKFKLPPSVNSLSVLQTQHKGCTTIRLFSNLDDKQRESFRKRCACFNVDEFLVSIFPFLSPDMARWQKGRRNQLEVFRLLLCGFILEDKINIAVADGLS